MTPLWRQHKGCRKCDGEGWLWAHELDKWHGEGSPMSDDTKYQCDDPIHLDRDDC